MSQKTLGVLFFLTAAISMLGLAGCQTAGSTANTAANNSATGVANTNAKADISTSDADEISRLLDEYNDALLKHDAATLERIWADDLSFVNPRGQLVTKAERIENIKSRSTDLKSAEVSEKQVRMYGNSAVATLIVKINGQYSGSPGSGDFRVTTVWAKPKGNWQMVSTQMTPIVK